MVTPPWGGLKLCRFLLRSLYISFRDKYLIPWETPEEAHSMHQSRAWRNLLGISGYRKDKNILFVVYQNITLSITFNSGFFVILFVA